MNENEKRVQDNKDTKLGAFVMCIIWILYALKWVALGTVIALPVLWLIHKPLWIAPIIGLILYVIVKIIWRLFWKFVRWSQDR
ncbi:MAG: hypothetical protein IKN97_00545 [Lachnospiraceae bacterium]|nr:hypothetical protein [Lachnospiraceae bacterium]